MSNALFTIPLNRAFSLGVVGKPKERDRGRAIDQVLKWSADLSRADLARKLRISPQRLNNWLTRDMPPREYARVAALYGRTVESLVSGAEDDPYLGELMSFWGILLPESKRQVLQHAKYIRTIQNPVPDPAYIKR